MKLRSRIARFGLVAGVVMGVSVKGNAQSGTEAEREHLASVNSGFGLSLLKELAREQPGANIFISPYSISSVLQMLSTGARGQTQAELQGVLGTGGFSLPAMNAAYESLAQAISSAHSNAVLNLANAIWYRSGAPLKPDFAAVNEKFYHATLGALNFSDPRSAEVMNEWAAHNTQGRIQSMMRPPMPADTAMVIANAIYFKGTWLDPFDPKLTQPRLFHRAKDSENQIPMMKKTREFQYQEGPGFQAVLLPYAGGRLQMHVLLPATNSSLAALATRMDISFWQNTILPGFQENRGTVVLPRFRLKYGAELKEPLIALGLKSAWNQAADFSGLSPSPLFLSEVKHQSFVEVNEEGTEAAAVTTGVMALASVRNEPPPFQMIVDRPFMFVISDRLTRAILFLGLVFDPGAAGNE